MPSSILKSITKYILIFVLPLLLLSCGDDAADSGPVRATARMPKPNKAVIARKAMLAKKAAAAKKAEEEARLARLNKEGHRTGMRNPFQSYIVPEVAKEERILGPLECCELSLFRLMAVISGTKRPRALIMAPDGEKYITKKGDVMGLRGGRITRIYSNKIVIEERFKDPREGKMIKEIVEIKLPSEEGKKK